MDLLAGFIQLLMMMSCADLSSMLPHIDLLLNSSCLFSLRFRIPHVNRCQAGVWIAWFLSPMHVLLFS